MKLKPIIIEIIVSLFLITSCKFTGLSDGDYVSTGDYTIINQGYLHGTVGANKLKLKNNKIFVHVPDQSIALYNIEDIVFPDLVSDYPVSGDIDFDVDERNVVYLGYSYAGIDVIDFEDYPHYVSTISDVGNPLSITAENSRLYVYDDYDGICVYDVSDPFFPIRLSSLYCHIDTYSFNRMVVDLPYIYILHDFGIVIASIIDDSSPQIVSEINAFACYDLKVSGDYLYVAESNGVTVYNVTNPSVPERRGSLPLPNIALSLDKYYDLVFVACGADGIRMIDVRDPDRLKEVDNFSVNTVATFVIVSNEYIFVADSFFDVQMFEYWKN
ncbi:MAG: hypothetical protein PHR06_04670 [Candidatus Cloacimonetes bacterium]|nr:hypothetical protein [Candidatus Cloacimonadota bacterium]